MIIKITSRFSQELYGYQISFNLVHKCTFYLNLKFLNGQHLKTRWLLKLNDEHSCTLDKDFILWVSFKYAHKSDFYLNLKFLNVYHFKTRWWTKLIIKIRSRFLQELYAYWVSSKSVHKRMFYLNLNILNGSQLWTFGKDFIHTEFHLNQLINMVFIWIWNF